MSVQSRKRGDASLIESTNTKSTWVDVGGGVWCVVCALVVFLFGSWRIARLTSIWDEWVEGYRIGWKRPPTPKRVDVEGSCIRHTRFLCACLAGLADSLPKSQAQTRAASANVGSSNSASARRKEQRGACCWSAEAAPCTWVGPPAVQSIHLGA